MLSTLLHFNSGDHTACMHVYPTCTCMYAVIQAHVGLPPTDTSICAVVHVVNIHGTLFRVPIPDLNPKNAILYSNRAFTHLKLKNYEQALSDARIAVGKDPGWKKVSVGWGGEQRLISPGGGGEGQPIMD